MGPIRYRPFRLPVPQYPDHAPFPHPAHRTGQADLPHPALGQDLNTRSRKKTEINKPSDLTNTEKQTGENMKGD